MAMFFPALWWLPVRSVVARPIDDVSSSACFALDFIQPAEHPVSPPLFLSPRRDCRRAVLPQETPTSSDEFTLTMSPARPIPTFLSPFSLLLYTCLVLTIAYFGYRTKIWRGKRRGNGDLQLSGVELLPTATNFKDFPMPLTPPISPLPPRARPAIRKENRGFNLTLGSAIKSGRSKSLGGPLSSRRIGNTPLGAVFIQSHSTPSTPLPPNTGMLVDVSPLSSGRHQRGFSESFRADPGFNVWDEPDHIVIEFGSVPPKESVPMLKPPALASSISSSSSAGSVDLVTAASPQIPLLSIGSPLLDDHASLKEEPMLIHFDDVQAESAKVEETLLLASPVVEQQIPLVTVSEDVEEERETELLEDWTEDGWNLSPVPSTIHEFSPVSVHSELANPDMSTSLSEETAETFDRTTMDLADGQDGWDLESFQPSPFGISSLQQVLQVEGTENMAEEPIDLESGETTLAFDEPTIHPESPLFATSPSSSEQISESDSTSEDTVVDASSPELPSSPISESEVLPELSIPHEEYSILDGEPPLLLTPVAVSFPAISFIEENDPHEFNDSPDVLTDETGADDAPLVELPVMTTVVEQNSDSLLPLPEVSEHSPIEEMSTLEEHLYPELLPLPEVNDDLSAAEKETTLVCDPDILPLPEVDEPSSIEEAATHEEHSDPELLPLPEVNDDPPVTDKETTLLDDHADPDLLPLPDLDKEIIPQEVDASQPSIRPAWSIRAADAPPLGLAASALLSPNSAVDAHGSKEKRAAPSPIKRVSSLPGTFPTPEPRVVSLPDVTQTASSAVEPNSTPAATVRRRFIRSPIDIALAMQLRPGLGLGADPAWIMRYLMSMWGWLFVLMGTPKFDGHRMH